MDTVRHIVIFKFQPGTTEGQIETLTQEFRSLKEKIPGIVDFEYGINNSPEGLNQEFTHIYMLTFESVEARDIYLPASRAPEVWRIRRRVGHYCRRFCGRF
jgi:hypothetical protein